MDNQALYRSPVRLVAHAGEPIGIYAPQTIGRAKKKLLAVAALENNELLLSGVIYTKNDIITLLDGITDEATWRHHCAVYAQPALLAFLEEAHFDDKELSRVFYQTLPDDVITFLSPWFATAFNQVSSLFLRLQAVVPPQPAPITYDPISVMVQPVQVVTETDEIDRFAVLSVLLDYQRFILPLHQHTAFERIRVYFHELLYTLRNLSWEKFQEDEGVLHFSFSGSWMLFANKLPYVFATTRDEVAEQVINISLRFQRKATWYYLEQLCLNMQSLECSEGHHAELVRLATHFGNNAGIASGNRNTKSSSSSMGRIIVWAIWIILALLRLNSCEKNNYDSSRFDNYKIEYDTNTVNIGGDTTAPVIINKESLDSILKRRK